eukprot:EG_transcript_34500
MKQNIKMTPFIAFLSLFHRFHLIFQAGGIRLLWALIVFMRDLWTPAPKLLRFTYFVVKSLEMHGAQAWFLTVFFCLSFMQGCFGHAMLRAVPRSWMHMHARAHILQT